GQILLASYDFRLNKFVRVLKLGTMVGDVVHFLEAPATRQDQEDFLKNHPGDMLRAAPWRRTEDAIDRLWPEYAAHHMIKSDDDSRWDEYPPIPIKGEKGQRAKDMEMGFDSATSDMDEQRGGKHLRYSNDMAR